MIALREPPANGFNPGFGSTFVPLVDWLLGALVLLSLLILSIVLGLLVTYGIRYRRGARADRRGVRSIPALEVALMTLGVGAFSCLFVWAGWLYHLLFAPPANAQEIDVVAKQWMWKFEHPEGRREIDTLHVPAGRPIKLVMISQDVIHSLFIPAFRTKHDVLPGRYLELWFEAPTPGVYPLFCTQYCGTFHSRMIGKVVVMSQADFAAWITQGPRPALPQVERGERLFGAYGCAGCHGANSAVHAPHFEGLYGRPVTLVDGRRPIADDKYLRDCILTPARQYVAGYPPIMPSFAGQLTEPQILDLLAYIRSLADRNAPGTAQGGTTP